jgi:hypothetical protein
MSTSTRCAFCNNTKHTFNNCKSRRITAIVNSMEANISDKNTWRSISEYLTSRSAMDVRLLARKNSLDTRIQKAFLIERLAYIYNCRQTKIRLREFALIVGVVLYGISSGGAFHLDDFDIYKTDSYLYQYIMRGINDMQERGLHTEEDRIQYVSHELTRIHTDISGYTNNTNNRYDDFMAIFADKKKSIEEFLIRRINEHHHPNDIKPFTIVPYMLVRPRTASSKNQPTCAICYNELTRTDIVKLKCGHEFCTTCIDRQLEISDRERMRLQCGLCRNIVNELYTENPDVYNKYEIRNAYEH